MRTRTRNMVPICAGALVVWACGGVASTGGPSTGSSGGASGTRSGEGGALGSGGRAHGGAETGALAGTTATASGGAIAGASGFAGSSPAAGGSSDSGTGGASDASAVGGSAGTGGSSGEAGAMGAGGGIVDGGPFTGPCDFVFQVTTVTAGGKFAPHNVAAIWIETYAGEFVKTLRTWGSIRLVTATSWTSVSGGSRVDAVTGATRVRHDRVRATWNCLDVAEQPVPDGTYQVCTTFQESNPIEGSPPSPFACARFDKGSFRVDAWPPSASPNFVDMHVFLDPL